MIQFSADPQVVQFNCSDTVVSNQHSSLNTCTHTHAVVTTSVKPSLATKRELVCMLWFWNFFWQISYRPAWIPVLVQAANTSLTRLVGHSSTPKGFSLGSSHIQWGHTITFLWKSIKIPNLFKDCLELWVIWLSCRYGMVIMIWLSCHTKICSLKHT